MGGQSCPYTTHCCAVCLKLTPGAPGARGRGAAAVHQNHSPPQTGKLSFFVALMLLICWMQEISALVSANHPYSTPEIIFLPIESGSDPYLQWLRSAVAPPPQ
jgi:hypothetical protein